MTGKNLAVIILGIWTLLSCSEARKENVIITVPDGFRGPVRILIAPSAPAVELAGGAYYYDIPTNGTLRVRDLAGLTQWHYTEARTTSGRKIPFIPFGSDKSGGIALFEISASSRGVYFFVGSEAEKIDAVRSNAIVPHSSVDLEFLRNLSSNEVTRPFP